MNDILSLLSIISMSLTGLDDTRLLRVLDYDGISRDIIRQQEWDERRSHILTNMQKVMGKLPGNEKRVPLDVRIESETITSRYIRRKISYQSAPDERVPAYLLIPSGLKKRAPAVLCLHQTTSITKDETVGLGGLSNLQIGKELAEQGFVVLAPDYPTLGEHQIDLSAHGWKSGSMKAIWDNMRAVDLLQGMSEVDPHRIGAAGHSLGGHNSLFTAAFDRRIKCVVTSCGFTAFAKYYDGDLTGWSSFRYMPRIKQMGLKPESMPFDFHEVLGAIAPRPIFISAPMYDANFENTGVRDVLQSVLPVYQLFYAESALAATFPDCAHDFPPASRTEAYGFLQKWLNR